jgi:hypothetical protein
VSLGRAVREIFLPQVRTPGFRQALLTLLIAAGGVILLLRRQRAWVVGYALVLAVTLLVWVSNGPLSKLIGAPWYHSSVRLNFNQIFFAALFAGVALAYAVDALTRFRPLNAAVASSLIVVVFVATVGWSEYRNTTKSLRRSFTVDARVTDSSLAAFDWLDAHANPNDVIVNDQNADGSLWMYAFKRLRPLFAIKPIFSDAAAVADWSDRMYVANHIAEIGDNSRADLLVRRFDAKWVYFDEQVFDLFGHRMHLDALRANKNLQLVFHQGTVYVFRIGDLARTTPSAG